ncbi:MAG: hypothetical protein ACK47B_23605 [Armatimonadota bacterium]
MEVKWDRKYRPWLCAAEPDAKRHLDCVLITASGLMVATDAHYLSVTPALLRQPADGFAGALVPAAWLAWVAERQELAFPDDAGFTITLHPGMASAETGSGTSTTELHPAERYVTWDLVASNTLQKAMAILASERTAEPPQIRLIPSCLATLCEALGLTDAFGFARETPLIIAGENRLEPLLVLTSEPLAFGVLMPAGASYTDQDPSLQRSLYAVRHHREPAQEVA